MIVRGRSNPVVDFVIEKPVVLYMIRGILCPSWTLWRSDMLRNYYELIIEAGLLNQIVQTELSQSRISE